MAIHSLHFCRASFLLGQRGLGVPQRGNISLYYGTVKKSQWHSFLLLSVSPLKSFVQTTGWSNKFGRLLFLQETNHFFSRLIDLLHFTCIFSITFFQVKQKASRMEFRFRAKSGNKTFDEPSYVGYYMYVCSWNQLPWYASFFQCSSPRFAKSARSKISAAPGMTDSGLWDGRPPGWKEKL